MNRPPWNSSTSSDELQQNERESFLEWRRGLAEYVITIVLEYSVHCNRFYSLLALGCKKLTGFYLLHLKRTWNFGGSYGELLKEGKFISSQMISILDYF